MTDERVDASPTKSFFVSMLTRDIKLEDAILDLLDNCVDGILRSGIKEDPKPYSDFWAKIEFDSQSFTIKDNCGGIPWKYHEQAFRMGRSPGQDSSVRNSVGVYGIGMKRAIFKIGRRCNISTQSTEDKYKVKITPDWMDKEEKDGRWSIPVEGPFKADGRAGTAITISDLNEGVADLFNKREKGKSFYTDLMNTISAQYAYILEKGFAVWINGHSVEPRTVKIAFDKKWNERDKAILPFVFKGEADGVKVFLAVGLTGRLPSKNRVNRELEGPTSSFTKAGWTVVCNDRVVLHCDRTKITGWGDGVPRFHTQFNAIAGIVEFQSQDPAKLPTTTTKSGVNTSSSLYLQVKSIMCDGTKVFTDYTNKWKSEVDESAEHINNCNKLSLNELKNESLLFEDAQFLSQSEQYVPTLPMPSESNDAWIRFKKDKRKIKAVAEYFGDPDMSPGNVGIKCFDTIFAETLP